MFPTRALVVGLTGVGLLATASTASAQDAAISAGPEVAIMGTPEQELPDIHAGFFFRLAWTSGVPAYTAAPRGYVWRGGLGADATVRAGRIETHNGYTYSSANRDAYTGVSVGLRYDIAFSQRRMGLLQMSGRGGFYFAARAGLLRSEAFASTPDAILPIGPNGERTPYAAATPETQRSGSLAVGTYILLGDTIRLGTEISFIAVGYSRDVDPLVGAVMRVSLGTSL